MTRGVTRGSIRRAVCLAAGIAALTPPPAAGAEMRVTLVTSDGLPIAGTFYEPDRRPAPMVLLLHMPTRSRGDWQAVGRAFAERGVGALAIDLRGHGESPSAGVWDPGADHAASLRDVQSALAWLKQRRDAVPGRIGIVGASLGANLAVVAAADDPGVRALVLLSVTLDFRGVKTEAALRKLGDRPALLVASLEDSYAARSARQLGAVGTGLREFRLLEDGGHGTVMLMRHPDLAAALVDWLCWRLL